MASEQIGVAEGGSGNRRNALIWIAGDHQAPHRVTTTVTDGATVEGNDPIFGVLNDRKPRRDRVAEKREDSESQGDSCDRRSRPPAYGG
jgi:hypothetical protein